MTKRLWGRIHGRPATHALLSYLEDGMLDLFLGLLLIDASVALVGGSFASSGAGFVVIYLLLLAAKEQVTGPRLAEEELSRAVPGRGERQVGGRGWVLRALLAFGAAVVVVWILRSWPAVGPVGGRGYPWVLVALVGLAGVAYAGHRRAAPRFIAYAAATAAALLAGTWLGASWMAVGILAVGVVTTAIGAALLGRFLRQHPRSATG